MLFRSARATSVEFQDDQIQLSAEIEATGNMDMLLRSGIPRKPMSNLNLGTRFHIRVEELSQPKFLPSLKFSQQNNFDLFQISI